MKVLESTPVVTLKRGPSAWIVNDAIEAGVIVGAGGHFCPVARHVGGADGCRAVVAKEAEFALETDAAASSQYAPELFFCRDLEGYGWCVRKGDYLNIGIGRRDSREFATHVRNFTRFLETHMSVTAPSNLRWRGHAYLASGTGPRRLAGDGFVLVGDAAGLAYPESGEGISPAIESGRLAAETLISASGRHDFEALAPYADALRRLYPPADNASAPSSGNVGFWPLPLDLAYLPTGVLAVGSCEPDVVASRV